MVDDPIESDFYDFYDADYYNIDTIYNKPDPKPTVAEDKKSMAVKAETQADHDRLWQSVIDYGRGT